MAETKIQNFIKKYRIDIIVVASLLILSLAVLLIVNLTKEEGAFAEVTVDGNVSGKYSLAIDGTYSLNGGTNTLVIQNGEAYMSYSNCPDHICENTGKIRHVGQTIICLPNRITVTIIGDSNSDEAVDFVS